MSKSMPKVVLYMIIGLIIIYTIILLYGFNFISFSFLEHNKIIVLSIRDIKLKPIFGQSGSLGDTIGGIFGPLVALIASLLTYWAFMEQVKANNLQFAEINRIKYDERFTLFLTIYRENVEKVESNGVSFQNIFNEFKFIYLVIYEKVRLDINKRNIDKMIRGEEMDLEVNFDDIVNISFAILIFGLDSVYDNGTLMVYTNSTDVAAYLEGIERLNQIRNGSSIGASVSYNSRFDNVAKNHYIKTSIDSFTGYGRNLENYFNNLDSFLDYIEYNISEMEEGKQSLSNLSSIESSVNILESQFTLFELFLLYFYGMSILSNTFGNLFIKSGLIFRMPLNKLDFDISQFYRGEKIEIDGGLSKYSDFFKS